MAVSYYEQQVKAKLTNKRKLSAFLKGLMMQHVKGLSRLNLTYVFCGDEYLVQINQQFLNHDTLTDIITFDLSEDKSELVGEIYISIERVAENAQKFGTGYQEELHRVIFHGALHLCGFKDKQPADKEKMKEQEDLCLKQYLFG